MNSIERTFAKSILLCGVALFPLSSVAEVKHWGYKGKEGPEHWASLTPEYGECSGKNQSPINLTHFVEADLKDIQINYKPGGSQIVNNGHAIQINYKEGSSIVLDGKTYNLLQFHFHAPSENLIDGKSYPMEGHFVHSDSDGNLLVIAVMFDYGEENTALDSLWPIMPKHAGDKHALTHLFDASTLLPDVSDYYRFNGSLTTPPCSEGVRWIVLKDSVQVSKKQIHKFKKVMKVHNNRPVQELNARVVLQ